ncbi:MAG: hypothetical protein NXI12_13525 [Alphaproteobacteria bacterium]|nr:hypothetical protein [Alphaproteobacteria bacterium]
MISNLIDLLWGLLDAATRVVGALLGFDPDNLTQREQLAIGAVILAFVPTVTFEAFKRVRILRCIYTKAAQSEGTWIEKIQRDDKSYVTMIDIRRRFLTNSYFISGETIEFPDGTFAAPSVYATFKSDSLHFDENHEVILTFNYSSSFTNRSENRTGLAKYVFPNMAKTAATGWFVGVLDGNGAVHSEIKKDTLQLQRITRWDWVKRAIADKKFFASLSKWKLYLAWVAHREISK